MTFEQWGLFVGGIVAGLVLMGIFTMIYAEKQIQKVWKSAKESIAEELEMEQLEARADQFGIPQTGDWKCVVCGCTYERGCPDGCYWVAPNLCSRCAERLAAEHEKDYPEGSPDWGKDIDFVDTVVGPFVIAPEDRLILELPTLVPMDELERITASITADINAGKHFIMGDGIKLVGVIRGSKEADHEQTDDHRESDA